MERTSGLGQSGFEQLRQDWQLAWQVEGWRALFHQVGNSLSHAIHFLEAAGMIMTAPAWRDHDAWWPPAVVTQAIIAPRHHLVVHGRHQCFRRVYRPPIVSQASTSRCSGGSALRVLPYASAKAISTVCPEQPCLRQRCSTNAVTSTIRDHRPAPYIISRTV
jgi:hypothetical protein